MSNHPEDTTVHVENTDPQARQKKPPPGIPGWGADLDPATRPAVPMERTPPRLPSVHWDTPERQPVTVKVFHSTERPGLTPVFGTAVPPSGASGLLRAGAYRFSENDVRRWMMLLFADRVNVVEGIVDDLARGHVPNLFTEMGGPAEWRYNRAGLLRKMLIAGAVAGALLYLNGRRRRR